MQPAAINDEARLALAERKEFATAAAEAALRGFELVEYDRGNGQVGFKLIRPHGVTNFADLCAVFRALGRKDSVTE